jgi:signal peptidase I
MADSQRLTKEPWLAVNLSFLVPGLGQFYAGAWGAGVVFLLAEVLLPLGFLWGCFCPRGSLLVGAAFIPLVVVVLAASLWHAHWCARKRNAAQAEAERKRTRDPYLAVFLTRIFPGIGHLYLRRWVVGVVLMVLALLVQTVPKLLLSPSEVVVRVALPLLIAAVYMAIICYLAWRAGPPERRGGNAPIMLICLLVVADMLLMLGVALLVRQFVAQAFSIPNEPMAPTLEAGDKILVYKGAHAPRRGDIMVFRNPVDRTQYYVKRVAALEGESVEFRDEGIYVNGSLLREGAFGRIRYLPVAQQKFAAEGEPFVVPPGHVFVVGDNTTRSFDSRFYGPVPLSDMIGLAYKRYWPPARAGPLE